MSAQPKFDEIGYWSEVKLDIIGSYASAYSRILSNQPDLYHVYIDGFAGAGEHLRKGTMEPILGSPMRALDVAPPFREYFFIDLDGNKAEHLKHLVGERSNVHVLHGDCNRVLLDAVFPEVLWRDHRRGLCVLDPYGLHLSWSVIEMAGRLGTIDLFLNFPIFDANRNALWHEHERVSPEQSARFSAYWGDESWRAVAYRPSAQLGLFRDEYEKVGNDAIAQAFGREAPLQGGVRECASPAAHEKLTRCSRLLPLLREPEGRRQ